ncbi:MAG: tRNA uridine-5-carboxymethylaminomethyl(34) synthesis GTPase MnmE [Spirochaetia bacterium]|nr:tRNA uridine-5-carboxymethylaminomethyl(34) synthesis GTPase MnmE [Spirochaetia bacterium]
MTIGKYTPEEPISSIATALAPAALGIVRVSGKDCIELVSKVFSRPKALLEAPGNTLVYGWIQEENKKIDEVMLAVYRAPKSFTGEDMVEIFCHGGPSVVTAIQNLMLRSGFRQADRGEYTFRAYINGKTDLTKAEAIKEIIDSHTDDSRSHAAGRLAGSLFQEIDSIKKLIIDTLAAIEVEIEYPEDEETIADTFDRDDIVLAISRLQSLVDSWKSEKLYQDGARVVLAGRTNAGKSSLFNAILKEERAIVSNIEGTTRDWLESWASINGIPVRLFDTAGLRETDDVIEAQGVQLTKNLAHDADVVLYLIDSTAGLSPDDTSFIENCQEPMVIVYTKSDLANSTNLKLQVFEENSVVSDSERGESLPLAPAAGASSATPSNGGHPRNAPVVQISSKNGNGLKNLFDEVTKILTAGLTTERQQAGLGSARQKDAVAEALECTKHALVSADDNYTLDAVVQDLEDALDALSEVTGDVTPDDVLGSIFANFCVGK